MTLVEQRTDTDCGVCCLAMALRMPYEVVLGNMPKEHLETLSDPKKGMSTEMYADLFAALGLRIEEDYAVRSMGYQWGTYKYTKNLLWGRRAICAVRSKNSPDCYHFVYWDGKTLYDPSTKEKYTQEEWEANMEPFKMYLFNEPEV